MERLPPCVLIYLKPKPTVDRPLPTSLRSDLVALVDKHGRRNRGLWGVNVPLTFGTRGGVQGGAEGRSNENDICFYSKQFLFSIVQVTYISAFCLKTERWNVRPTGALPKESLWKTSLWYMWLAPQNTSTNHFWMILRYFTRFSVMLIV